MNPRSPHTPSAQNAAAPSDTWVQSIGQLRRKTLKMRLLIGVLRLVAGLSHNNRMRLGALLTRLSPWLLPKRIRIVERNLALCFADATPAERTKLLHDHLRALTQSFVDRSVFWFGTPETIRAMITVNGHAQVPDLIARHGSIMLLAPHFVGLDAAATRLTMEGPEGATMYTPQNDPDMDTLVRVSRARFNTVHLVSRRDGIRPLIRFIDQHLPIYYLPDMDFGRRGAAFVPFFGIDAATQTATAQIARKWHLPVLPVTCFWDPASGHYHVEVLPPLEDFPGTDSLEDATARLNTHLESWVRQCPSQYYWVHRRFKTRPTGQPKLY